jgi:hypothetical protein
LEDNKSKRVLQLMKEKIQNKWLSPDNWSSLDPPMPSLSYISDCFLFFSWNVHLFLFFSWNVHLFLCFFLKCSLVYWTECFCGFESVLWLLLLFISTLSILLTLPNKHHWLQFERRYEQ